jgi:MFS family permease
MVAEMSAPVGSCRLVHRRVIRTLTLTGFGFNVACGGILGLLVVHADQVLDLHATDPRIGLLYTAIAVGSLIATLVMPRLSLHAGQGTVSIAGYAVFVLAVLGLAGVSVFPAALALWATWACARLLVNGNGITVRQLLTPDELQGRVNTTGRMISWGGVPFGALLGGGAAETLGVPLTYAVLAVPAVIGLAVLLASPVRGLRVTT